MPLALPTAPRILIVKMSSMGDVVHALPAVTDLLRALPQAQVDWMVEPPFAAIAQRHPGVRRVIPTPWRRWRKSLRSAQTRAEMAQWQALLDAEPYDLIIDLQGLLKSALLARRAHGPIAGYGWRSAREPLASLFYRRRCAVSRQLHAVERCRRLVALALGLPPPAGPPDFGLPVPPLVAGAPRTAMLIPCASRPEKLWPLADWIAIGRELAEDGWSLEILWGSPDEEARAREIAAGIGPAATVPPFLTVAQAAERLAAAGLVVGLDTGLTHLAAAHGAPTLGLYCDHEPGLAGVTGPGPVRSLGGKGQRPSLADVRAAISALLAARAAPSQI
ncbi:MAG: lipopolysaccharide heptosyltransferase I [Pseudomonadota bacterium]